MVNRDIFSKGILLLILLLAGCVKPVQPGGKQFECDRPPADVFTATGIDFQFAESTFGKVVTGDIKVKSNPQVIALASQATIDYRIRSYMRCLAIKRDGFTHEQAAYFDLLAGLLSTKPTTENFLKFQEKYPFPKTATPKSPEVKGSSEPRNSLPLILRTSPSYGDGMEAIENAPGDRLKKNRHRLSELKKKYEEFEYWLWVFGSYKVWDEPSRHYYVIGRTSGEAPGWYINGKIKYTENGTWWEKITLRIHPSDLPWTAHIRILSSSSPDLEDRIRSNKKISGPQDPRVPLGQWEHKVTTIIVIK